MATDKITVRPVSVRGKRLWRVRRWEHGKPKRTFFSSEAKANAEASRLRGEVGESEEWRSLSARERNEAVRVWREHLLSVGASKGKPLQAVIDELVTAKENAGREGRYVSRLKLVCDWFAKGRGSVPIDKITLADIEGFLDGKALASRSTLRARISTLMKFAVRRGYRPNNPCERLEAVTYVKPPPKVFTVEQFDAAAKCLALHPVGAAWFALSTVCGLRPEEAQKTTKHDINFAEGFIKVEAQTTKVRERRVVYPRPEAMAFVKWAVKVGGRLPLPDLALKRSRKWLRQALGFSGWPKDITRHTAASYWLATGAGSVKVSEMLGNSEKVLKRDYKALVTRADAERFWEAVASAAKNLNSTPKKTQRKRGK